MAPNHEAMMLVSTAGDSNHGTRMLYVNAERKASLVDPLVPHFVWIHAWWDSIFMLDRREMVENLAYFCGSPIVAPNR